MDTVEQEMAIFQTFVNKIVPENALTNTANVQPQIPSITVDGELGPELQCLLKVKEDLS